MFSTVYLTDHLQLYWNLAKWLSENETKQSTQDSFFSVGPKDLRTGETPRRNKCQANIKVDPKIINLSRRELNENETKLLKRGLKFTPTPSIDHQELKEDIHKFCRRLRLVEYFADKNEEMENH